MTYNIITIAIAITTIVCTKWIIGSVPLQKTSTGTYITFKNSLYLVYKQSNLNSSFTFKNELDSRYMVNYLSSLKILLYYQFPISNSNATFTYINTIRNSLSFRMAIFCS